MDLTDMVETKTTINTNSYNKKLSIQIDLNGLSFCILDQIQNEIIYFKKIAFEKQLDPIRILSKIELAYEKDSELSQPVDEVVLVFSNSLFSLVPKELFNEKNAASYLQFNTKILKTDFIAYDEIRDDMVNVYIPYANIINFFFERYGEFEYKHSMSILIESLLEKEANPAPVVYLHAHQNQYELLIIEDQKLLFANSFQYETKEDFLYYLLFTAEQLNLDPLKFELVLIGSIEKESEEYIMAWNYIKNISFAGPSNSYSFKEDLQPVNPLADYLILKSL